MPAGEAETLIRRIARSRRFDNLRTTAFACLRIIALRMLASSDEKEFIYNLNGPGNRPRSG